ncbi:MAG TPA: host attachment protein [Aestuariivirgaceae bacterium]|nr:host attachment protein [Aestuariivirgaceae bacterium]
MEARGKKTEAVETEAAPPAALGVLRKVLDRQVSGHIIAEIGKDLTNWPVSEIEQALTD